jgi:hypothetical protein
MPDGRPYGDPFPLTSQLDVAWPTVATDELDEVITGIRGGG